MTQRTPPSPASPDREIIAWIMYQIQCKSDDFGLTYDQDGYVTHFANKYVSASGKAQLHIPRTLIRGKDRSVASLDFLPAEIGYLRHLRHLSLSHLPNLLSLPPEIGELPLLERLDVTNCGLTTLPSAIGQLQRLRQLNLSGNRLKSLPKEIGQLVHLRELNVNQNQLTSLPPEIGELANIINLFLAGNQLISLPGEIYKLQHLVYLDLSQNQLASLPRAFGQLSDLRILLLDDNHLSTLPPEIGQLRSLATLSLTTNRLTQMPPEIGKLTHLSLLDLRNNQLTALPGTLTGVKEVKLLVEGNPIAETLPLELQEIGNIRFEVETYLNAHGARQEPLQIFYDEIPAYYSMFGLIDLTVRLIDEIPDYDEIEKYYEEGVFTTSDYIGFFAREQFSRIWMRMESWAQVPPLLTGDWQGGQTLSFLAHSGKLQLVNKDGDLSPRVFSLGAAHQHYQVRVFWRYCQEKDTGESSRGAEHYLCQFWPDVS